MKKRILCVLSGLLALYGSARAQENLYNDSTEFVYESKMVVDTALVTQVGNAYAQHHLGLLTAERDALQTERQTLQTIMAMGEKDVLTEANGTLALYTSLLEELKAGGERSQDFVQRGYWRDARNEGKVNILGMPKNMNTTLEKELEKAEKQLTKKQRTYPAVANYAKFLSEQHSTQLRILEQQIRHFEGANPFRMYEDSIGNRQYPKREIQVQVKNKYYRPALFQPNYNESQLNEVDAAIQKRGWEWIDTDEHKRVSESYPISYTYDKYESHPAYKVVSSGQGRGCVYDQEGGLVFVPSETRNNKEELKKILLNLAYQKDYKDNKYDILKEDKDVQYAIVNRLGLSKDNDARVAGIMAKGLEAGLRSEYGTLSQRIQAERQKDQLAKSLLSQALRMMNDTADKFLEQLKKDHSEDYEYIYRIERASDTSFIIHYTTKEMKPFCDVRIGYQGTKPYECDWKIDEITSF